MPDRLERDIDEVLDKIEDFEWHRAQRRRPSKLRQAWNGWWQGASDAIGRRLARFSAGHLMLAGFLILVFGIVVLRGLGLWFVLAGMILFLLGLFLNMRGSGTSGSGTSSATRGGFWRDRYIEYDVEPRGIRRLFRRRRR
jgi:hypothetical protein